MDRKRRTEIIKGYKETWHDLFKSSDSWSLWHERDTSILRIQTNVQHHPESKCSFWYNLIGSSYGHQREIKKKGGIVRKRKEREKDPSHGVRGVWKWWRTGVTKWPPENTRRLIERSRDSLELVRSDARGAGRQTQGSPLMRPPRIPGVASSLRLGASYTRWQLARCVRCRSDCWQRKEERARGG